MNNNLFIRYIDFLQKNKSQKIHKEKLWNFSELKKPYVVNNAGLVRNDWDINKQDFNFNNLTFS